MATLQNIRSKGPLLIIVVGLALFAFIAGDAWKVLQPHQSQDVGEINGESVSAQEFRDLLDEYTEIIKFSNNLSSLTDEQNNQIQDELWNTYVNNKLIEKEAEKLGLAVPNSEIQAIIDAGVHPMLRSTPFFNQQTGRFDRDMLTKFLADYAKMDPKTTPDYYKGLFRFWNFIERTLKQNRLAAKYDALISKSIMSNPVEAKASFDGRVNQSDLLLAAIPYSAIADSTIKVKVSEVKDIYNKRKEEFRQDTETRDIRYIDVQVTPSAEDRSTLEEEVLTSTGQLEEQTGDYSSFVRSTGSEFPFVDLYYRREAFPADVIARLDSAAIGETYGPYYNTADNTFNSFKKLSRITAADSIEFRQIQVYNNDLHKTRTLADSIYNAIKGGADFVDLAARYNQPGTSIWISSSDYEGGQFDNDNLKFISTLTSMGVNETVNVENVGSNVILQVTNKKNMMDKYKVAVIKRTIVFSKETYNRAYNDFSQFVAANSTLDKLVENAEDAGYRIYSRADLRSSEHGIGGIARTKDALRWVFNAKPGEVSGLYEAGNNDRMLVVALEKVHKEGFRSLEEVQNQLRTEVVKDKKATMIMADMKAANATTFEQYKAMADAVSDSVKHVTFAAPAYVSVLRSSEPLVGAFASVATANQLSNPIKGNSGVYVLQVYSKETLDETFSIEDEKTNLRATNSRFASRYVADLYRKAKVKDNRYLFF